MKTVLLLLVSLLINVVLLPAVQGQAMSVIGGDNKARECYVNAGLAAELEVGADMLEPCNYALDHVRLSPADRAATYANRGVLLAAMEDYAAALEDYEAAMEIRPATGEIYVNRGNSYFMRADYDMAIADYSRAIELNIRQIHIAFLNRGLAWERLGNASAAEEDYRTALYFMPDLSIAERLLERLLEGRKI